MAARRVTLQTIADQLNVSKVTVHKALNDKSGVSDALRQKIRAAAAALGYLPQNDTAKTLLYLFPMRFFFKSEPFYTVIFYHLEQLVIEDGYELKLAIIDEDEYERKLPLLLQEYNPCGIFIGGEIERRNIHYLETLDLPLVFIDFYSNRYHANYVYADNYHGAYYLTKYLIERGHERIAFVGDPYHADSDMDRYFGYQKAMMRNRLPVDSELCILNHIDNLTDLSLIRLPEKMPTAFLCHSSGAALELYLKLQTLHLRIPEDVSVVSFDNTEMTQKLRPKLTVCGVPQKKFATQAWRIMQSALQNPQGGTIRQPLHPNIYENASVRTLTEPAETEETTAQ